MADYIAILDTQVDPDAPITSSLGYQFKNNVLAIAEGSAGAPRILLNGAIERLASGGNVRLINGSEVIGQPAGYVSVFSVVMMQGGIARFGIDQKGVSASAFVNSRVVRVRNSSTDIAATWTNTTSSYVTRYVDLDVIAGDIVRWEYSKGGGSSSDVSVKNFQIATNGQDLVCGEGMGGYITGNRALT